MQHNHVHSSHRALKHVSSSSCSCLHSCGPKGQCRFASDDLLHKLQPASANDDKHSLYNSMNSNINSRLLMNNVGENEIHFFSSSVPKDKRTCLLNEHYAIDAKNKKRKKNKKKKRKGNNHHANIFGIENVPQNRYYIDKERKRRERKNKFEGLIVIKKLTQDNIIEAQSLYDGHNPKLKLSLDMIRENARKHQHNYNNGLVNNSSHITNDKPVSTSRKNRFAYYSNKHNNNNNSNGNICNNTLNHRKNIIINSKSSTSIKSKSALTHNFPEGKAINSNKKPNYNLYNGNGYSNSNHPIPTCDNLSRSHQNGLTLRLSTDIPLISTPITKTAIYKYETNKTKRAQTLDNQTHLSHGKPSPSPAKPNDFLLKHSSSCGNYARYQTAKAKQNNSNSSTSLMHNSTNFVLNKPNTFNSISPNGRIANNRYSTSQSTVNKWGRSKAKAQQQSPEAISVIQSRKELAEKQSLNFKDFKSLLYCIVPGNASYLVKHCMSHRINWKETFSSSSSLFNFKWRQISFAF